MADGPDGLDAKLVGDGQIGRRALLKGAVIAGTAAAVWSAPIIEGLGMSAGAATPCDILSPQAQDKNSNSGSSFCVGTPCCGQSFGSNSASGPDEFTFLNPIPNCSLIKVQTIPLNCAQSPNSTFDPDIGQFALVINQTIGTACGDCKIKEGVLLQSSGRVQKKVLNNGPHSCAGIGAGVNASLACNDPIFVAVGSDARLAVRITCNVVTGTCNVIP
jgi:hypothetical protein